MKKAIKIIILVSVGLVVLGGGMAFVSFAGFGFKLDNIVRKIDYTEKTYDITDDYANIDLNIGSQSVQIVKSPDEDTHFVSYENEKESFNVSVENDTLKVEQLTDYSWKDMIMVYAEKKTCMLYLPKEEYEKAVYKVSSGDVNSDINLSFEDMNADVGSGSISLANLEVKKDMVAHSSSGAVRLEEINAESLDAKTGSGSIKVTNVNLSGVFHAHCSSGSISVNGMKCADAELKTGSGTISVIGMACSNNLDGHVTSGDIKLDDTTASGEFRLKAASGDIKLSSCDGGQMDLRCSSGDIRATLKTGKVFEASASSGDVDVPVDSTGNGTCVAHTGSGDIKITIEKKAE